jgi:hypothetical protein
MRRIVRLVRVHVQMSLPPELVQGLNESETPQHLSGYVLRQPSDAPRGRIKSWGYRMVEIHLAGDPSLDRKIGMRQMSTSAPPKALQLRPVGRLVPVIPSSSGQEAADVRALKPVPSGQAYRITSTPAHRLVTAVLAEALKTVFEQFAREQGFSAEKPLMISLSRGFKANSHGHKEGRAADIDAVGGKNLLQWKQEWDRAMSSAQKVENPEQRAPTIAAEQRRNLGYRLYKALQAHGGWRINPGGWRVYQNVMQLFGPWTATDGPWEAMQIENPTPQERQRLADQQWVFRAHQDHIHVAK